MSNTLISRDRIAVIERCARETCRLPGVMAEFGVWRGGSALVACQACPAKTIHLFDTWVGLPEDDVQASGHKKGDFRDCDLDTAKRVLAGQPAVFHQGVFPGTTNGLEHLRFSYVHIDCDTEQSVQAGVDFFQPRMIPGGIMVLDDYGWHQCPGVKVVVDRSFTRVERPAAYQCVVRMS